MTGGGIREVHGRNLTSGGIIGNGHNYRVNGGLSVTRYLRVCLGDRWRPRQKQGARYWRGHLPRHYQSKSWSNQRSTGNWHC